MRHSTKRRARSPPLIFCPLVVLDEMDDPMPAIRDPIAFELFKNAVFSIADEMALTVFRTTYSGVLKDNMDYSTGIADANGKLVAQGLTLPGHLGSVPTAMASIMRHYTEDIPKSKVPSTAPCRSPKQPRTPACVPCSRRGFPIMKASFVPSRSSVRRERSAMGSCRRPAPHED
ncbi:MAG: hypothetical protein EXR39_19235 [Betaproteobacteria bacterium]|nr:hypothetical protein [Betaproteobacteria bacterium]